MIFRPGTTHGVWGEHRARGIVRRAVTSSRGRFQGPQRGVFSKASLNSARDRVNLRPEDPARNGKTAAPGPAPARILRKAKGSPPQQGRSERLWIEVTLRTTASQGDDLELRHWRKQGVRWLEVLPAAIRS